MNRPKLKLNLTDAERIVVPLQTDTGQHRADARTVQGSGTTPASAHESTTLPASSSQVSSNNVTRYVDPSGKLSFSGKAILHGEGIDFNSGNSYKIKMSDLEVMQELGRGQYGIVSKVRHKPTNTLMSMKQIRLSISENAMRQIIMELEVLHKSHSPNIVEFYGAFFFESCVYYCMEFMNAGSLDRLYGPGIAEPFLSKIADSLVSGLKFLKEELSIMHRDVKPTNILVNLAGQVKLCDFGVSGQLIKSLAKTNIGCQSYMAPERIMASDKNSSYTVTSDIWSLGLSLWEAAMGRYPFSYDSVFSQLSAIINGEPEKLKDEFSEACQNFISACLQKDPNRRPNYSQLSQHEFLLKYRDDKTVDMKAWAEEAHRQYYQNPPPNPQIL